MKWKKALIVEEGTQQKRPCLAIFPTTVEGHVIWLEWFWVTEEWTYIPSSDTWGWETVKTELVK